MILGRFLEKCVAWYSCGSCAQKEPVDIDLIVPISYCVTPEGLARATRENFLLAVRYARQFPHATTAFSNVEYVFQGAACLESSQKHRILKEYAVPDDLVIETEPIVNSVEEARAIRTRLDSVRMQPRRILLITGAMHAPSARLIWGAVFPEAQVLIRCIPHEYEAQADHPITALRTRIRWLAANIARHLMLLALGLRITARFRHLISHGKSNPSSG